MTFRKKRSPLAAVMYGSVVCAALAAVVLFFTGCNTVPKEPCPKSNLVKSQDTRKTTGRWILFSKKNFVRKPGQMMAMTVPGGKPLEGLNALVFEKKPILRSTAKSDLVLQEERVYHILQSPVVITPYQCPTRPDCPTCPTEPPPVDPPPTDPAEVAKSWGLTRMKALEAKAKVSTKNVKICVVDTGIDLSHPDRGNVVASTSFTGEPVSPDVGQHGTHVAGTIAGRKGSGVGVSEAALYICKGLSNNGSGSSSSLAQCLNWCAQQGAHISSNSWGGSGADRLIDTAVTNLARTTAVVIANGNDSRGTLNCPACLARTTPNVYGIAASDESNRKASFSTYGPGTKYIAPGTNIISNRPGGGTQSMSGTSMATPGVAGAMAYCVAMGKPVTCLKTVSLGLDANQQGGGMPDLWQTVQ